MTIVRLKWLGFIVISVVGLIWCLMVGGPWWFASLMGLGLGTAFATAKEWW